MKENVSGFFSEHSVGPILFCFWLRVLD